MKPEVQACVSTLGSILVLLALPTMPLGRASAQGSSSASSSPLEHRDELRGPDDTRSPAQRASGQREAEDSPQQLMIRAQALIKAGQAGRAANWLERLADRKDLTPLQQFQLASLLGEVRHYKQAIQLFNTLPATYPDPFSRNYGLALAYFEDHQYPMCITVLQGMEKQGLHDARIFNLRGVADAETGDMQSAYAAWQRGISAAPNNSRNYLTYAAMKARHLQYGQALQALSTALERISGDYKLFLARGSVYMLMDKSAEAQADCEKALALEPTDSRTYLTLGLSYMGQNRFKQAAEVFGSGIRHGLRDAYLYYFLADVLIREGVTPNSLRFRQALSAASSCLEISPDFAYCDLDRARLELMAGQLKQAIADLRRARSSLPDSRSVAYNLALAYQKTGEKAKAESLLDKMKSWTADEFQIYRTMLLLDMMTSLWRCPDFC